MNAAGDKHPTNCAVCLAPIEPTLRGSPRKYCSPRCQQVASIRRRNERRMMGIEPTKVEPPPGGLCRHCGVPVVTKRGKAPRQYCSKSCSNKAIYQRAAASGLCVRCRHRPARGDIRHCDECETERHELKRLSRAASIEWEDAECTKCGAPFQKKTTNTLRKLCPKCCRRDSDVLAAKDADPEADSMWGRTRRPAPAPALDAYLRRPAACAVPLENVTIPVTTPSGPLARQVAQMFGCLYPAGSTNFYESMDRRKRWDS